MTKERYLDTAIWLPRPLEEVFAFFSNAENLERLTPPFLKFRIATPVPIEMAEGIFIDYRLRVHGIPMKWRSRIAAWEPPFRFVDEQVKGPYASWHHEHLFAEENGGTLVRDRVTYRVPGWILEPVVNRFFVGPDVKRIFAYRQSVLTELFGESDS